MISKTVLVCLKKEGSTFGFTFSGTFTQRVVLNNYTVMYRAYTVGGAEKGRPLTISNVRPGTAAYRFYVLMTFSDVEFVWDYILYISCTWQEWDSSSW